MYNSSGRSVQFGAVRVFNSRGQCVQFDAAYALTRVILSGHQLVRFFEILRRDRVVELPYDVHGFAPLMGYIIRCAKEGIGLCSKIIFFMFPYKEQDPIAEPR